MRGVSSTKRDQLNRLRRIEGQVRGIAGMVEEDQYRIDILTQVSAASPALRSVALGLPDEHINQYLLAAAHPGGTERHVRLKKAPDAIARLVRS
jgi:DNA-binding FrmR family transcriptional regulator